MERVECTVLGYEVDFDQAKEICRIMAKKDNEFTMLVSWCDRDKGVHSPCCLKCEFKGEPGWEVYGRNHEGRLRISVNSDQFVFIYS